MSLDWGSSVESLSTKGHATPNQQQHIVNLTWEKEAVFGGLQVRVNMQGALGSNTYFLERIKELAAPDGEYTQFLEELIDRLGPPHFVDSNEGTRERVGCGVTSV